jgi:superfamily II DNA or RNA helicase
MRVLRPYQNEATDCVFEEWKENDSTLVVMPTGTGKTVVFSEVIKRALPKRTMVLVHRAELAYQAADKIKSLGIDCCIEMADQRAKTTFWGASPVVISTVQTQISGDRRLNFKPSDFGQLILDEAHHGVAESWVKIIDYYKLNKDLRVLGVTATPDRADEEALGQIFKTVAFDYEILDAINDGWLVPIKQQLVLVESLDFSGMRTTAGDLNGADLAEAMEAERNLHGVVSASIEIIGNRRALVFAVSVKQAEMYSEIFNRHRFGMSDFVSGKTPKELRKEKLAAFDQGKTQVMVNVGVLTEGYDSPGVEIIIQARPTKSRSLYSQMVGRSTRPLPGIVDLYSTPEERRSAIAASAKPSCLVVDFVGNSGRHKLMTTADILGGKFSDEEIARAEKNVKDKKGSADMTEELEKAREELEQARIEEAARKAKLIGKARFVASSIDPFDVLGIKMERDRGWNSGKSLSPRQRAFLQKQGINPDERSYHQNKQILGELFKRMNKKAASFKQIKVLQKHGYDTREVTFKGASEILDSLAKNGWDREKADAYRAEKNGSS